VKTLLKFGIASVWLVFGLVFKVLGAVPRHRLIVSAVLGTEWARPITVLIGLGEAALGVWVLTEVFPRTCAACQTIAIATMNAIELHVARNLLLTPVGMVLANAVFLSLVWYWALHPAERGA